MRRGLGVNATGALGFVLIALALAQLVLPRIAAKALRDRVARYGDVQSASVYALPALQLLWGSADSAKLSASRLEVSPKQLIALLVESKSVTNLTVNAHEVDLVDPGFGAGTVSLRDAVLRKRGESLDVSALLSAAALQAALPPGMHAVVSAGVGDSVQVDVSGQLFGFRATISARVHVAEGKLLLTPTQPALAGLAKVTLFSDPKVRLESVAATPAVRERADGAQAVGGQGGGSQAAWVLHLRARLR